MVLRGVNRRYQHLKRYRQIAETLLRHGFGFLLQQLDLLHLLPWRRRFFKLEQVDDSALGRRLRLVLEELGPTFVKLGQMLSTRGDMISHDVLVELQKLQDEVPGVEFAVIKEQVEQELGRTLDEVFDSFEEYPMAAASIGQVHRAVINGEAVVVKVRRPGIQRTIETDLEILQGFARLVQERYSIEVFDPVELIDEFARELRRELDYTIEARNASRFRDNLLYDEHIHVPRVYWPYTTPRVLTMELVIGTKVNQVDVLQAKGIDVGAIAKWGAQSFMEQVMVHGYFHGDPHPGNILIEEDGTIAFIDFGIMGRLDKTTMGELADLFISITRQDIPSIIESLRAIAVFSSRVNLMELERDLDDVLFRYYGKALVDLSMSAVVEDLLSVTRKHGIGLPSDFALLVKSLILIEGVGRSLDDTFNIFEIAEPFARDLLRERYQPHRIAKKALESGWSYSQMLMQLPSKLDTTLDLVNQDRLQVIFRHKGLEELMVRLDIASNRLSFALIVAALVIGSSFMVQSNKGPALFGLPALGVAGFLVAAFFGIWLIISIVRSGRI
ncbi:MAG: AarF/ABC1/UbiB kinase family protein [Firmicutes bacterium]|nr:AarF/ABC1/UbiB kinase family protein [Bacillota bacterium]